MCIITTLSYRCECKDYKVELCAFLEDVGPQLAYLSNTEIDALKEACEECSKEHYKPQTTECPACVAVAKAKTQLVDVIRPLKAPDTYGLEIAKKVAPNVSPERVVASAEKVEEKNISAERGNRTVQVNHVISPNTAGPRGALIKRWMRRHGLPGYAGPP